MKQVFILVLMLLVVATATELYAQAPQSFKYQSIARDGADVLISDATIQLEISIHDLTPSGSIVYKERHAVTTNSLGLFTISVGAGETTNNFALIDWGAGSKFIEVAADFDGGTNFKSMGISQLLSVPYALHSASTSQQSPIGGFEHYIGEDFNDGIIFFLYRDSDGKEHGYVVSKTEQSNLKWDTHNSLVYGAASFWDGFSNMGFISNSPAKNYIQSLGSDWYWPAIEELSLIWTNKFLVGKALFDGGFTPLSYSDVYWSSTEGGMESAYWFSYNVGISGGFKGTSATVRAIKKF